MTDTEFHQLVDKVMNKIEEQLDQYDGHNDIDCETAPIPKRNATT